MPRLVKLVFNTKERKVNLPINPKKIMRLQDTTGRLQEWTKFLKEMPAVKTGGFAEIAVLKFLESKGYKLVNWQSKVLKRHDFDLEVENDSNKFFVEVKSSSSKHLMVTKIEKLLKVADKQGGIPCIAIYRANIDKVYLFALKEMGTVGKIRK